ncbi:MAG: hypothetical protein ACRC62_26810 [Microcoleus sp.]
MNIPPLLGNLTYPLKLISLLVTSPQRKTVNRGNLLLLVLQVNWVLKIDNFSIENSIGFS